ncbi:hypothetical protein [Pedobacter zeae]|uniref:Uncharacterized protein n=1 Tax=Pedobacter zeae TaxID=1737356 RepID=A0A7W6K9R8_9SPHI|nr:hypothetical protein [Pedobacter zeae]MBB4107695.1 hypothetical protein [Pedobacter zeae]GGG97655.1 hypothetical protein GCM10007422_09570 [Pedobacter zeae]
MKIAYINSAPKPKEVKANPLELAYIKDIRIQWIKYKKALESYGLTEEGFVKRMREKLEI